MPAEVLTGKRFVTRWEPIQIVLRLTPKAMRQSKGFR